MGNISEWDLARQVFELSLQRDPMNADVWALLAEAQQQSGSGDGSLELKRALALDPDSMVVRSMMTFYYERLGEFDIALTYIYALTIQDPQNHIWHIRWGELLMKMGYPYDAMIHFQRAAELKPDEAEVWAAIAGCSIQNNIDIVNVGVPAARKAVLLSPENPLYNDVMGAALLRTDDMISAERFLLRAVNLDPAYLSAYYHLGQYYMLVNKPDNARYYLDQIIRSEISDYDLKSKAERLLERDI